MISIMLPPHSRRCSHEVKGDTPIARKIREMKTTAKDVAIAIGVERKAVMHWCHGQNTPSVTDAILAANALGCTVEELFGEEAETRWNKRMGL